MRLTLGFLIFLTAVQCAAAAGVGEIPDSQFLFELKQQFMRLSKRQTVLADLLREAIRKSGQSSDVAFFAGIRYCAPGLARAAAVIYQSEKRITFVGRVPDEPPGLTTPETLKVFYDPQIRKLLPAERVDGALDWRFDPDMIQLTEKNTMPPTICVRSGSRPAETAEALGHEFFHYLNIPDEPEPDALSFSDLDDYARKKALSKGDEVEAYLFQISAAIRRSGLSRVQIHPMIRKYFSDSGEFLGKPEDLLPYILDELTYRNTRFREEYLQLLDQQTMVSAKELSLASELLREREQQEKDVTDFNATRRWFVDFISPSYRTESERGKKLVVVIGESKQRLRARSAALKKRLESLESRRAALKIQ